MSTDQGSTDDGFEFVRKMWGNMGFGLPGMVSPTLDVDELERRIKDLKAVEGWLKMNLGMLQMSIQGLEVQRSTLAAMQAMSRSGAQEGEAAANPFANPALWSWPFPSSETPGAEAAAAAPSESAQESPANTKPPRKPSRK
ncbi:MAG: hypothetical protein CGU28_14035 [Candidatus Dactylopiibacterium carminicum]|uniref:Uncharacterized protein n=1 Tax=Candidatus Dactylopiibacterium carminicum TaxID=857335 RepID=A0A272ET77_9RHOO|nr:PhaM family polyhydroxyalkanoate granule multifunctional regulatory protein [Candidatus Dactylopiibacterium carminicum]KAF7599322.1 hypothetical protein BGI27_08580 [Candidatus Dactylopiibacterium carminicum]PAS93313.1 MAG: hypothetical protein CGU29_08230 [Candidatus Dactylopiibacterium carminicum]PAS94335.1 MAG: hypothetical protein CGU28_14035 [Candidatus Dactylopiibacterium carminicum]PAS99324.1 MAG: hypothetical protein BSR46_08610 [Candidatus Dactylopiibacterium carminicum]